MTVFLVTRDSAFGRFLASGLHAARAVDRIIIETGRPSWRFYWRKLRRVGPVNGVFQFLLNRWFRRAGSRRLPPTELPPHEVVENVNGYPFGDDALVIGFGTSYITARTLAAMQHGFLNLHTGWLPDYRGVKSEFWAIFKGDDSRAGWTLHFMTPKLDEGDIVIRRAVPLTGENPAELRAKLIQDAVPALREFVASVRAGGFGAIPRQPQGAGRYYTTPTWREWRSYRRLRRQTPDNPTLSTGPTA
jgi:hypothetical protein